MYQKYRPFGSQIRSFGLIVRSINLRCKTVKARCRMSKISYIIFFLALLSRIIIDNPQLKTQPDNLGSWSIVKISRPIKTNMFLHVQQTPKQLLAIRTFNQKWYTHILLSIRKRLKKGFIIIEIWPLRSQASSDNIFVRSINFRY